MLMQCLFAGCMLAVVIVGLLVMTRAISLEELGQMIRRVFLLALSALIALYVLRSLLLPILTSWIVTLKCMVWWIVIIAVAIVTAMFFLRMLGSKLETWLSAGVS